MTKKQWIDGDGNLWNGSSVVIGETRVINPTDEQMLEAGYTEYTAPEPTDAQRLGQARQKKLAELSAYDQSDAVDGFSIGGVTMWLTVSERQQIATQIAASEAVGRTEMTRWFGGHAFTFPLATWQQMLVALEVYAGDALNVTEQHRAAISALGTAAEVEGYDFTIGYPDKLAF